MRDNVDLEYVESVADQIMESFLQRHQRVKEERRSLLNTWIGLSGGALVLSVTVLQTFIATRNALPVLVVSWLLYASSLAVAIIALMSMTVRSARYQLMLHELIEENFRRLARGEKPVTPDRPYSQPIAGSGRASIAMPEIIAGLLFAAGVAATVWFVLRNL